ncbi:uncharacterized protein YprB with RNaseH-like and TPR domain [Methanococcus voltae PS]|uniref:Uncharacterized protein YprB with RNaseH-like and TPR domain n=1 Tax=Methanococcus voltae PS TaxID=523842 RepID=A0ABT2EVH4_METVO|nr:ribonuclease H-like domain-containing protein [Methanococcus voltae]MCS3921959.1 uncharacterized protein YprB with RNaseH-like and TPR domain [Methanococcus voltae PS]
MKLNPNVKKNISGFAENIKKKSEESSLNSKDNFSDYEFSGDAEYTQAMKLKSDLLKKYGGKELGEVFDGQEVKSKEGTTYCIEDSFKCKIKKQDVENAKRTILSDFTVIKGIAEATEFKLKNQGYDTLYDLQNHEKFGHGAKKLVTCIEKEGIFGFLNNLPNNYSKSSPNILRASKFHELDDFIVYDIETMGLSNVPIFLFGMSYITEDEIHTKQFFARNISEEAASLYRTVQEINQKNILVTFNGKTFDVPRTRDRLNYYELKRPEPIQMHYDLRYFSKRAWGNKLENCKLQTVEKELLNEYRKDDVPSYLVPDFYKTYDESKNIGPIVPVITHNKIDVVTSAKILNLLWNEW